MLKPSSNYKMSKSTKTMLTNILDPHKRGEHKRSMIQAELAAAVQPKREKNKKEVSAE